MRKNSWMPAKHTSFEIKEIELFDSLIFGGCHQNSTVLTHFCQRQHFPFGETVFHHLI